MKIKSKYKLAKIKNGKPFYGEIILYIEENTTTHTIIENYDGNGFISQGTIESIPPKGYEDWKQGIKSGIHYGLSKITDNRKFKVTIVECNGFTTDTNPTILAFVASRAILEQIENNESTAEKEQFEELIYSSWNNKFVHEI